MGPMTKILNPVVATLAGRRHFPMAAQIHHVGRRTGTPYVTSVGARVQGAAVLIPLTFGNRSDWTRNVRAAGQCSVRLNGKVYQAVAPAIHRRRARRTADPRRIRSRATTSVQAARNSAIHAAAAGHPLTERYCHANASHHRPAHVAPEFKHGRGRPTRLITARAASRSPISVRARRCYLFMSARGASSGVTSSCGCKRLPLCCGRRPRLRAQ